MSVADLDAPASPAGMFGLRDVAERALVEDSADVIVIGSGAAGATSARVLSAAGLEVIVLEEGSVLSAPRSDMYTSFKHHWRDMGLQAAEGRAFTPLLQGRVVGGTTVMNGAIIHRLPEPIYDGWAAEHAVNRSFSYAELERVFDALDRELMVGPAPDAVFGENNRLMQLGVERIGATGNRIQRSVSGCRGSAHCNQGCPTRRKQSMDVSFIPRALEAGARLYYQCRAERVRAKRSRAEAVEGRFVDPVTRARGPRFRFHARRAIVVCASAIQTPGLLAASGVGRRSRLLGERLQAHPGTGVVGVFDAPVKMSFGATQGYESKHFWHERMKFEAVGMPLEFAAARLPGIGPALMQELASFDHLAIWGVQIRAEAQGQVRRGLFGGTSVHYDLTDADVERLKLGVSRLIQMMFAAGAREVLPGVHGLPERISSPDQAAPLAALPSDPRRFHCIAAHLFGTAKLGLSPHSSVVDLQGQVHDSPGLYVMDSSIFPTNLGVNPQHSISALAWLLSERLAERKAP
ncbi:MAG: GMC family oxidoreductase [Polyangiaceae bacterium]|nr:GMC family oxidoreductase [Polyangiaceae bacterium]MCW5791494.1 GMC family oxidoreductase [Polyangiaceae bacterium]